ncbi:hypothetical protein ACLB2K_077430 [Fragaria x ananassa]
MGPSKKRKLPHDDAAVNPDQQQGIEQLRDVVSVSGVNLAEEQDRMLSGPNNKDRFKPRKFAFQEKEEELVLEKNALRRKMAGIMERWGFIIGVERDVESVSIAKNLGIVTLNTSDVRQEIMALNKKAREGSQARKAQKIHEANEVKDINDDGDDRMRKNRAEANVAARAAVGGHDILAKWQLKAELARQKKYVNHKAAPTVGRTMNGNVNAEKRGGVQADSVSKAGSDVGKFGRNAEAMMKPQTKVASMRSISVKDVIAVLEKEPQMSKSTLIYSLMNTASRR